jgi:hypothetical protein
MVLDRLLPPRPRTELGRAEERTPSDAVRDTAGRRAPLGAPGAALMTGVPIDTPRMRP